MTHRLTMIRGAAATVAATLTVGAALLAVAHPAAAAATATPDEVAVARANAAIEQHRDAVRGSADDRYQVFSVKTAPGAMAHVRYTRQYRGLPVLGGDFVVHLTPAGEFDGVSISLDRPIDIATVAKVSAAGAAKSAGAALKASSVGAPSPFVDAVGGVGRLAWQLPATTGNGPVTAVVDAQSGQLVRAVPTEQSASGTGNSIYGGTVTLDTSPFFSAYLLVDPLRGNATTCNLNHATSGSCATYIDSDNVWGDGNPATSQSAAVDAAYGAAKAFDYYKNVLGRNGVFNNGVGVTSRVHRGNNWQNAHWDTVNKYMEYGDGANNLKPLVALDVAGHEMTHGVTQNEIPPDGLIYQHESGGLNESTSDIFGTMTEFYANNPVDTPDYDIGELIDINGNGTPLRYMYHPSLDGASKDCWDANVTNLDPHYSSGVGNHFYFLLAEGSGATSYGTSPTCNGAALTGIGRTSAAKIWYKALSDYFVADETYADARADTMAAAKELYGMCSTRYRAVANAWAAVGVGKPMTICLSVPIWHFEWIEWPRNPIPDPGPLKWIINLDKEGTLSTVEVAVNVLHARPADVQIDLISPEGRAYRLKSTERRDNTPDIHEVFEVDLGAPARPGEWTLLVTDTVKGQGGYLNGWSILY